MMNVLWITAGLGCDGESVAITAATQPSIEDIILGGLPGLPAVNFLNPFYACENGDEFLRYLYLAREGQLDPFILVIEGSIPNEEVKSEGYRAALGNNPATGQPIPTCDWIDRLAPKAWAVMAVGTCATYGGIHAMEGNPTTAQGQLRLVWAFQVCVNGRGSSEERWKFIPAIAAQPLGLLCRSGVRYESSTHFDRG